jgi:hypothetical protein
MTDREQVRVIVVSDHRRGTVHGMTNDHAEAQQWTRELIAKYGGDNLSAGMTGGLVEVPTPETAARVRAQVAEELWVEAQRIRAEVWPSKVGIEYVEGFEEAGAFVEKSADIARQNATDDHQETDRG